MNFLAGFILLFCFYFINILKLRGAERSPSPTPGTSAESDSEQKKTRQTLNVSQKVEENKGLKRKRSDDDGKANENDNESRMSDELKTTAINAMIEAKTKIVTHDEFIRECILQLITCATEMGSTHIPEGSCRHLLTESSAHLMDSLLSNLNLCSQNFAQGLNSHDEIFESECFFNLNIIKAQLTGMINTMKVAVADLSNFHKPYSINFEVAKLQQATMHSETFTAALYNNFDISGILILCSTIKLKRTNVNARILELNSLQSVLRKLRQRIHFLTQYQSVYTHHIYEASKRLISEENVCSPLCILLSFYNLRKSYFSAAIKLKYYNPAYSPVLKQSRKLRRRVKQDGKSICSMYTNKMEILQSRFLSNPQHSSDIKTSMSKCLNTYRGWSLMISMNYLFIITKLKAVLQLLHKIASRVIFLNVSYDIKQNQLEHEYQSIIPSDFKKTIASLYDLCLECREGTLMLLLLQYADFSLKTIQYSKDTLQQCLIDFQSIMEECATAASIIKATANQQGESDETDIGVHSRIFRERREKLEMAQNYGKSTEFYITDTASSNLADMLDAVYASLFNYDVDVSNYALCRRLLRELNDMLRNFDTDTD